MATKIKDSEVEARRSNAPVPVPQPKANRKLKSPKRVSVPPQKRKAAHLSARELIPTSKKLKAAASTLQKRPKAGAKGSSLTRAAGKRNLSDLKGEIRKQAPERKQDAAIADASDLSIVGVGVSHVFLVRSALGVTQEMFARLVGTSLRSVAGWERGEPISDNSRRRVAEMERLASALTKVMKKDFIKSWLANSNEEMGGISPLQALESGHNDRFWRSVFLLGSGLPV